MNEPIAEWTGTRSCEVPPGDGAAREGKAGGLRDGAHPPEGCHRMLPKGGSQPLRQVSGRMRKVLQCRDQEGCGTSSSGLGGQGQARWLVIWVGSEEERLCTRPDPIDAGTVYQAWQAGVASVVNLMLLLQGLQLAALSDFLPYP